MVVLLQRWQRWWLSVPHLCLLLLLAALCRLHDLRGPVLICWVVKQGPNVVHEQGVEKLSDLLLVCKIQSPFKWNPVAAVSLTKHDGLRQLLSHIPDTL